MGRKALQSKRKLDSHEGDARSHGKGHKKTKQEDSEQEASHASEPVARQDDEVETKMEPDMPTEQSTPKSRNIDDSVTSNAIANVLSGIHFYLHCPNTPSSIKSLIPIKAESKIADVVQDRLLLEFPTIFIRNESPDQLTKPFILEEDYANKYGDQAFASTTSFDNAARSNHIDDPDASQIDEKRILEVLQKDLVS